MLKPPGLAAGDCYVARGSGLCASAGATGCDARALFLDMRICPEDRECYDWVSVRSGHEDYTVMTLHLWGRL